MPRSSTVSRTTKETDVTGGADARRAGDVGVRHRAAVLRPHAAATREARRLGPVGHEQGRSRRGRAPHGRGRRAGARPGARRGARRQGRHPTVRLDRRAAGRGGGRGRAGPVGKEVRRSTRSTCRPRRSARSTPVSSRTSFARSPGGRPHGARPAAIRDGPRTTSWRRSSRRSRRPSATRARRPAAVASRARRERCRGPWPRSPSSTTAGGTSTRCRARSRTPAASRS